MGSLVFSGGDFCVYDWLGSKITSGYKLSDWLRLPNRSGIGFGRKSILGSRRFLMCFWLLGWSVIR